MRKTYMYIKRPIDRYERDEHPIAFGVSFNLNLQSQSPWSLFNGTW